MKYIIGPQSLASVLVKPATLDTEIPALKTGGQHRYNGHCSSAEFFADECSKVQFVYLQMPAELRTPIRARELTVFGVSKGMRLGDNT